MPRATSSSPKLKKKTKKELLIEQIAKTIGAGREVAVETVDFSDPNRPKTCLEVDFPILPINQIAAIEGNAGKPIYQMSKWWARRRSSVFRSLLLAASMKAPEDESKAAKAVWDAYYANHQKRGALKHLKVVEPFMGGGTTIVEGSRLGMQMFGCDLNPVAWFVVKNEMADVDLDEVKRLLADIEAEVKPQIMPYYACDGPNGEKGKWFRHLGSRKREGTLEQTDFLAVPMAAPSNDEDEWEELPSDFDIFNVRWQERKNYRYEGPEILHNFWVKHGPCQREGCGHRTPIMSTPIVATKTLTVKAWHDWRCPKCDCECDVEMHAARMAPDVPLFIAPDEKPHSVVDLRGKFTCPHCGEHYFAPQAVRENEINTETPQNHSTIRFEMELASKKIPLALLVHPEWLQGCSKHDSDGSEYGGSATDPVEATQRWNMARAKTLRLLEVRGLVAVEKTDKQGNLKVEMTIPLQVTCPATGVTFRTDEKGGTVAKSGHFACHASTCGMVQPNAAAFAKTQKTAPVASLVIQGISPKLEASGNPYGGRFFKADTDVRALGAAWAEWENRKDNDLAKYWPRTEIPFGHMTHQRQPLPDHGYTHWWKMFNPRQLLVCSLFLKAIATAKASDAARLFVLGFYQNFLRNENMFCFWHASHDHFAPHLSNNNFHPKTTVIEVGPFCPVGYGPWPSAIGGLEDSLRWKSDPWEIFATDGLDSTAVKVSGRGMRIATNDPVLSQTSVLRCGSATHWEAIDSESVDLAITDPPFGGLLHYSELSDFFYVWLRLVLETNYPAQFGSEHVPKALEAVANEARHPEDPDGFYQRVLADCWRECHRILKPSGILAFTFHHSEDDPWVRVLTSLFDAGFYLEATYPIRSDETKGEGEFGSKQIEYDIIHVCRKRMADPEPISWARLRRQITDDVRRIKSLLAQHRQEGLPAADLQVIKRGKALEYFSRHYGKVFIERDQFIDLKTALLGINSLLDDDESSVGGPEAPPSSAEPYTRQFFRLFYETCTVDRDQMQKFLRGTGIPPSDFEERGWCSEKNKVFHLTPPLELAEKWKGLQRKGLARDFDQAMFLVGACHEGSGIRVEDTLNSPNFAPHPATGELVEWLCRHGGTQEIKFAAQRARTLYREWLAKDANKVKAAEQLKLFDLDAMPT